MTSTNDNSDDKSLSDNFHVIQDNCIFNVIKDFYVSNRKQFKIGHININSIRYKFEPIREILQENILDVLAIQETKIDTSFPESQFAITRCKLYRQDYKSNEGGLLMFIRNDIPQFRRHDIEKFSVDKENGRIEILAVEVSINKERWIFLSVYKQPKVKVTKLTEVMNNIMIQLEQHNVNIVFTGDFNINMLKPNEFADCLDINGLSNLVKETTCFKGTPSLIDLIITNNPQRFKGTVVADTGLSDFHCLLCTATKQQVSKLKSNTFQYRTYKHFNEELFLQDLTYIPYHVTEIFDDVNDSYWLWYELTMQVINQHAPNKTRTVTGHRVPYMNGELRRAINVKNMLKRKYDRCKSTFNWNKYRTQRNLVTSLLKKSINVYIRGKCNNETNRHGKTSEFWNTVKPLISHKMNKQNDNIILKDNDQVYTRPESVATTFNNYFTNIARHIGQDDRIFDEDSLSTCIDTHINHDSIICISNFMNKKSARTEFNFNKTDATMIRQLLNKLSIHKATGFDQLPSKLLKMGSNILAPSICSLVNMSFDLCSFPNCLKYAEISPIFKKGSDLDVANYRPVSILPSMSKIFERIMVTQLSLYFEDIFSSFISGFRSKHSCETVLVRMIENIKYSLDEGKIVCLLIMDLSRAFDSIPYKLFISKLRAYGLSMEACQLIFNYYYGRKQRVKLGNTSSDWQYIYKGSAQGSIIVPVSYNIFANDMLMLLDDDIDVYNYADDNSLACTGNDYTEIQQKLVYNVNKIMTWFQQNNMKVNPDKFDYIVFGKHDGLENIIIGDYSIKPKDNVKILGLHLDNKLKFDEHITKLCQNAGKQVQVISRLRHVLDEETKLLLYNCFVECYFNYCSIVWHFCSKYNTYKLEKTTKESSEMCHTQFYFIL